MVVAYRRWHTGCNLIKCKCVEGIINPHASRATSLHPPVPPPESRHPNRGNPQQKRASPHPPIVPHLRSRVRIGGRAGKPHRSHRIAKDAAMCSRGTRRRPRVAALLKSAQGLGRFWRLGRRFYSSTVKRLALWRWCALRPSQGLQLVAVCLRAPTPCRPLPSPSWPTRPTGRARPGLPHR